MRVSTHQVFRSRVDGQCLKDIMWEKMNSGRPVFSVPFRSVRVLSLGDEKFQDGRNDEGDEEKGRR